MNAFYKIINIVFTTILIILLSSCASDDGSPGDPPKATTTGNTDNTENKDIAVTIKGVLVDGYIKGATVCLDSNKDGKCVKGEMQTTTNDKGEFSLDIKVKKGESYILIGAGGVDTATGEVFTHTYKASIDSSKVIARSVYLVNITPLSTLVSNIYVKKIAVDLSYGLDKVINLVASSIGVANDKLLSDPLKDSTVFKKTQIILQTVSIISASIQIDNTKENVKKAFDFVLDSLSASVGANRHRGKLDVSALANTLGKLNFNNKTIIITPNVQNLAIKNIENISKQIDALGKNTIDISKLTALQKTIQVEVAKIVSAIISQNQASNTLATPIVTNAPKFTKNNSVTVEVKGKENTILLVNNVESGTLTSGKINIDLNTSGADGAKDFNLTLKDGDNYSNSLILKIIKNTTPPAKTSTIDDLVTDDTTPPLSGKLPSESTANYTVKVRINNKDYDATNDGDKTWSIADNIIEELAIGSYDVNITVTDETQKSSTTNLANRVLIDNSGFLIDSAIEGIGYISGSYKGWTDVNGLFKYDKSAGVTFYIGDDLTGIPLGTASPKTDPHNSKRKIVTLFDLASSPSRAVDENNNLVVNMGTFLQSLDSDGDISNGITIDDRTKESITLLGLKNRIDFSMDITAFRNHNDIYDLLNDLADHFGEHRGLKETKDVKAHLVAVRDNVQIAKTIGTVIVKREKIKLKILSGVFKSSTGVVQGLEYRSGNQFGRTDSNGTFKYEEGKKIKFYVYQLELGITETKPIITPADLIVATSFNHPKPRNIIRLLKAFDSTSGATIVIDNAVRSALEKYRSQIDVNLPDGKANPKLNIPKGKDEFGAQFEEFEMGKDILDEITKLRGES